jgi:hypothetical protein
VLGSESSVEDWNRERPDVIVKIDGEVVGIEVTTLTDARPRQAIAPRRWIADALPLVHQAQEVVEARNPSPLVVRFSKQGS